MHHPQPTLLCRYRYDALDRLISHSRSAAGERHSFYCKSRLATEIQGAIGTSIVQHGDLLLAQQRHEHDAPDTTLLATDLQRSVLHTLKTNTERQPITYSPYGHRRAESGLISLLAFNGERPDPVTRHYLLGNGYRAFNPVLMRFNSPDSLSPFGKGGVNAYAYCLGDPVNLGDNSGHTPSAFMGLFGKISQMPDVLENIIQRLPGKDMVSLARTSKAMKEVVYSSAQALPEELSNIKRVVIVEWGDPLIRTVDLKKHTDVEMSFAKTGNIQLIGSGLKVGNLPVQLANSGIDVAIKGSYILSGLNTLSDTLGRLNPDSFTRQRIAGYSYGNKLGEGFNSSRTWTIRSST
jgi:RHS repeat-associated protein